MPTLKANKQARFNYDILETLEAGIVLSGAEVKSAKRGNVSLHGSYVSVRGTTAWLINCHIAPYQYAQQVEYNPTHDRQLLLQKHEISSLIGKLKSAGLTLIPLSVYSKRGLVKVQLGLGRGKRKFDKRASIKKRETDRSIRKALRVR